MLKRRKTKTVRVGSVRIGSAAPIAIQSMTKVPAVDIDRSLAQIHQLVRAGCHLVRVAVPRRADTAAFARLVEQSPVPLIADVHFSAARAIEAIEAGAAKVRLNPGNIRDRRDVIRIIDAAQAHGTAIRAGINEASIRDLKAGDTAPKRRVSLMAKEMEKYVRLFERRHFSNLVLSAKSSDCRRAIAVNQRLAEAFDYPLHLGLTHAGLPQEAKLRSAVTLGTMLAEGIGDTIRVSIAGDPAEEIHIATEILAALGLSERPRPQLIVCPTCGRCQTDILKLAKQVRKALRNVNKPLRIAVMGCVVNGPGEAADADLALCAGKDKAYLYRNGVRKSVVPAEQIIPTFLAELEKL